MTSPDLFIYHTLTPYLRITKPGCFLFGHGVTDKQYINPVIQDLQMRMSHFTGMVRLWRNMGFSFLSMEEALKVTLHGQKINKPWIHLTFDDGYRNNYTLLYPFMKAQGIPFTVFLSTRNITEQQRFDNYKLYCSLLHTKDAGERTRIFEEYNLQTPDKLPIEMQVVDMVRAFKYFSVAEKEVFVARVEALLSPAEWMYYNDLYESEAVMSPEEVKVMSGDPLVTFASHGHNHYILSTLDDKAINYEQQQSRLLMKELTGYEPQTYCYPNGKTMDFPEHIGRLTSANGYMAGFTTVKSKITGGEDPFKIPRLPLSYRYMPKLFLKLV